MAVRRGGTVAAPKVMGALVWLLLTAGVWTPVAGAVMACAEASVAFPSRAHAGIPAALAVQTIAEVAQNENS